MDDISKSFWRDILETIVIEFPSVDLSIIVGVHFGKKLLVTLLDHLPIEILMRLELLPYPSLELFSLEEVVPVLIVF